MRSSAVNRLNSQGTKNASIVRNRKHNPGLSDTPDDLYFVATESIRYLFLKFVHTSSGNSKNWFHICTDDKLYCNRAVASSKVGWSGAVAQGANVNGRKTRLYNF